MRALVLIALLACACAPVTREVQTSAVPTPVYVATITPATAAPSTATSGSTAPATGLPTPGVNTGPAGRLEMTEYPVPSGQGPHDVAPAADGGVWYTAQRTGELGYLDPKTGTTRMIKLGNGSAPHGVIVGPDGAPWVTDGGLNAIVRVDPRTTEVVRYPLPAARGNANLNTATFDKNGTLWFTGQNGVFGRLDPRTGAITVFDSPRGAGPYGIATCPDGNVYYASLASSFVGWINIGTGQVDVIEPPTARQGARRVWCDTRSNVWVSEWNAGTLARYRPAPIRPPIDSTTPVPARTELPLAPGWTQWKLPGANPMAYAVFVDDQDVVWLTDWGANAIIRFDPRSESFTSLPHSAPNADVRQLLGRSGEVWGAMSGQDKLVVVRVR